MKVIWLVILAQFLSVAGAGPPDSTPPPGLLERARTWVLDHVGQSARLFLYQHLPAFFPLAFVCRLEEDHESLAVLPRDQARSVEAGARLACPDTLSLTVEAKLILKIYLSDEIPVLEIRGGSADIIPAPGAKLTLRTGESSLRINQTDGNPTLALRTGDFGTAVYTDRGFLDTAFSATGNRTKFYLGTLHGRITLRSDNFSGPRFLLPGDLYAPLDLMLPKDQLERMDQRSTWWKLGIDPANTGVGLAIELNGPPGGGPIMTIHGPAGRQKCQLFTRGSDDGRFVKAYEFNAPDLSAGFRITLHPDYPKYRLILTCADEQGGSVTSNELTPPPPAAK